MGIKSFSHTFQFELSGVNNYWRLIDVLATKESSFNTKESVIRLKDYFNEANEYQSLFYPNLSNELIVIGEENITTLMLENSIKIMHKRFLTPGLSEIYTIYGKAQNFNNYSCY